MKEIRLNKLTLENFKRFKDLVFEPNGRNAVIKGPNEAGKTTVYDAFHYLLFGKDSSGHTESQFSLKTKDERDIVIPMIDHIVEGELVDDGVLKLKRNYRETWTKKNHKLTGHTTDYWIDGEPDIKKRDFDARIAEIISPELFKILTSVTYFADLSEQDRRRQLFQLCEGLTEDALHSAEKQKKITASKKAEIEKKKKLIPARIDEKERDLTAIAELNQAAIQTRIDNLDKQIQDIKSDSTVAVLQKEQAELETRLSQIEAGQEKKKQEVSKGIRDGIKQLEDNLASKNQKRYRLDFDIGVQVKIIDDTKQEIEGLYSDWDMLKKQIPDIVDLCPTCGKAFLPDEKEAVQRDFNLQQSKKKEEINAAGKAARAKKEKAAAVKIELEVDLKQKQIDLAEIQKDLKKKNTELGKIDARGPEQKLAEEIETIHHRIIEIEQSLQQKNQQQDLGPLEADLATERAKMAKINAGEEHKARIKELLIEEKTMAAKIEKLEASLFWAEEELKKEAALVEAQVNEKFDGVQFSLFETKLNSSVVPCCKILLGGNEWGHGTSTGQEIIGGLNIIKVLQEHYSIKCPIFLDRAESLTIPLPEMNTQIIRLEVDKSLDELEMLTSLRCFDIVP